MPRVVVTGLGLLTPLGNDAPTTWDGLIAGRSGITRLTSFDASAYDCPIAGELHDWDPTAWVEPKLLRRIDRSSAMAMAAARLAVTDAALDVRAEPPGAVGVLLGTGIGGAHLIVENQQLLDDKGPRRVSPFLIAHMLPDTASGLVAIALGADGANFAITAACSTGGAAIGEAAELIARGDAQVMLAGGFEAPLRPVYYAGFQAMRALAEHPDPAQASRPFDRDRNGFVLSEGAGVLVLEALEHAQARGAHIYAECSGSATTNDAFDMVAAAEDGRGIQRAMERALARAAVAPDTVDYINAHGTGTPLNDRVETRAIRALFGAHADRLLVSSTKSALGHMMGAAGAVEAAIAALACHYQLVPPTINYATPDPDCDLDYVPNTARRATVRHAMSTSVGLGGHNSALVFARWEDHSRLEDNS
ncbi:MAG: beta-ketoacyl-ACP synthase II [Chloroflexi bacterium]|nr:beta-ketoacyl-ACP synthase II [Chloroflexota bacterium]